MKIKKSAKDVAFDKERAKYRQEIRTVERDLRVAKQRIKVLENTVAYRDYELSLRDERLKEYEKLTGLSEQDLKDLKEKNEAINSFIEGFNTVSGAIPNKSYWRV